MLLLHNSLAYPNQAYYEEYQAQQQNPVYIPQRAEDRKFAEKPNAIKKVTFEEIEEIKNNEIGDSVGFSWSNILSTLLRMVFPQDNAFTSSGPSKENSEGSAPTLWQNLLQLGLKILSAIMGGGAQSESIEKIDSNSPLQGILAAIFSTVVGNKDPDQVAMMAKQAGEFISIIVNLLDALKTSFSQRSLAARSIGQRDMISDISLASLTMTKGFVKAMSTAEEKCAQKFICEANLDCRNTIEQNSSLCHLASYATVFFLDKSTGSTNINSIQEAGRKGRSGENCVALYSDCRKS